MGQLLLSKLYTFAYKVPRTALNLTPTYIQAQ